MKQFILKNIVLVAVLAITLVGSIFLIFFIWSKSMTIQQSMEDIEADVQKLESINSARKPNSVEQSEKMIKADTETLNKKKDQIYRHFGRPYRPALLKLLKNIASPGELKTDLSVDPSLVAKPKPKVEAEETGDDDAEVAETEPATPAAPAAPTDEEKAIFNPASNLVVLSFDEDSLRSMLADLYKEIPQESSEESFVIPDTIQAERAQLFEKLFNQIIEAPEAVDPARAEDFRKAAAAKFAQAFAIFREEVQALTLEDVTYSVAHELFLDALGLPRLMRQRVCRDYIDILYEKYLNSDIIPGRSGEDSFDRTNRIQDLIYGKNVSKVGPIVPDMVIPILRNLQIKEDLFRRMKDSGIGVLRSMSNGSSFFGTTVDNDPEGPILLFSYTLDLIASQNAIDNFINSLQAAYKDDLVYMIKNISFSNPESQDDLVHANAIVERNARPSDTPAATAGKTGAANQTQAAAATNAKDAKAAVVVYSDSEYDTTDPHHSDYGRILVGEHQDSINCTIVVDYLYYRADNITPQ